MAYKFFQVPTAETIERAAAIDEASHGPVGSGKNGFRKCNGICGQTSANLVEAATDPVASNFVKVLKIYTNGVATLATVGAMNEGLVLLLHKAFILGVLAGQLQAGVATEFAPVEGTDTKDYVN